MRKGSLGVTFFLSARMSVCPQILGNSIRNARDGSWLGMGQTTPRLTSVRPVWTGYFALKFYSNYVNYI